MRCNVCAELSTTLTLRGACTFRRGTDDLLIMSFAHNPPAATLSLPAGVDKKTSVLDYVVKSLYDKQEEGVLAVIEDLNLVEESARLSGTEVLREFAAVRAALDGLQEAYQFNQTKAAEPLFNSPTAKKMIDEFSEKLEAHLSSFQGQMQECERSKVILTKKLEDIVRYFGEEAASCDTSKIFGTLQEFLRAVAFSKAAVEWRLYRSQSNN